MNFLTQETGDAVRAQNPLMVDDIEAGVVSSVSETLTYNGKAAAGAITVNSLTRKPVFCTAGDRVGSFWGRKENLVRTFTSNLVSLVETAGSAAFVVVDPTYNLELAFESGAAPWRYVAKVYDRDGSSLYGWIAGVAASTNSYTFTVYSTRAGTTKDWNGSLANFDNTMFSRVEIYKDQTSLAFGTGTALTTEVNYPFEGKYDQEKVMTWALGLSNGEFGVDYSNGLIIGKKADTTASETVTYSVSSNATVASLIVDGSSSATPARTSALAASLVVKASAGVLYGFSGFNNSASAQYIQVHDSATLPADTAVPEVVIKADAGENFFWSPTVAGVSFTAGIVLCNSSTAATKTIGSADCWFQAEYK